MIKYAVAVVIIFTPVFIVINNDLSSEETISKIEELIDVSIEKGYLCHQLGMTLNECKGEIK